MARFLLSRSTTRKRMTSTSASPSPLRVRSVKAQEARTETYTPLISTDIPPQARELYRINKVRLLYDRDQPTARMCCRDAAEVETPLDMTHSLLRAMSPIHVKYLSNMGVRSSMSISIV